MELQLYSANDCGSLHHLPNYYYQPFDFISELTQSSRWRTTQRQHLGQSDYGLNS